MALENLNGIVDISGRSFPVGIVKNRSDVNIKKEIGEGNFGKVYQGFFHLNDVQRYNFLPFSL